MIENRVGTGGRCTTHDRDLPCEQCMAEAAASRSAAEHAPAEQTERFWERVRQDREALVTELHEAARDVEPAALPPDVRVHVDRTIAEHPGEHVVAIDGRIDGADETFDHHIAGGGIVTISPNPERGRGVIPHTIEHPTDRRLVVGTMLYDPDFIIGATFYAMGGGGRVFRMLEDRHGTTRAEAIIRDLHNASVACDYLTYPDEGEQPAGRAIARELSDRFFEELMATPEFTGKLPWQAAREHPELFARRSGEIGTAVLRRIAAALEAGDLSGISLPPDELDAYYREHRSLVDDVRQELTAHPERKRRLIAAVDVTERKKPDPLAFYEAAGTPVVASINTETKFYNPIGVHPAFYERLTMLPVVRQLQVRELLARAAEDTDAKLAIASVDAWLAQHAPDTFPTQLDGKTTVRGATGAEVSVSEDVRDAVRVLKEKGLLENQWGGRAVAFGGPLPGKGKYSGSQLPLEEVLRTIEADVQRQLTAAERV
jgi:hypothetical protein